MTYKDRPSVRRKGWTIQSQESRTIGRSEGTRPPFLLSLFRMYEELSVV